MVVGDNFVQAFLERFENLLGIFLLIAKIQKQDGEQWTEVLVPCDFLLLIDKIQPNQLKLVVYPPLFDQDVEGVITRSWCTKMTDANRCWNLGCFQHVPGSSGP